MSYLGLVSPVSSQYIESGSEAFSDATSGDWASMGFDIGGLGLTTAVSTGLISTGVGAPLGAALMAGETILNSLHIGSGRREADAIVPVQNVVGDRLIEINSLIDQSNIPQLQAFHLEVENLQREFTKFVHDPRFTDGRASQQALDTMNPTFSGTLDSIERDLYKLGGVMPPPQLSQHYGSSIVPTLRFPIQNFPWLPQAGTLPPIAPLSQVQARPIQSLAGFGNSGILPLVALGALAFYVIRKRG